MKKFLSLLLASVFIVSCLGGCSDKNTVKTDEPIKLPEGSRYTAKDGTDWVACGENDNIRLSFQPSTTYFKTENLNDGTVWYSNPQYPENDALASKLTQMRMMSTLVLEYADVNTKKRTSLNLYTASVKSGKYEIKLINNGVRFDYTVDEAGGVATLAVYVEDDSIVTEVAFEKTDDSKPAIFVSAISPLQYFVSGNVEDSGYLFVPDGSGALIDFENDTPSAGQYSRPIFGEEPTNITADYYLECDNQALCLPVYGAVKNGSGIFAVAEEGAEFGTMKANSCGQETYYSNAYISYGFVNSVEYNVGNYSTELFDKSGDNQSVMRTRYLFLSGDDANYSGMARAYRDYLTEKYGLSNGNISHGFYADVYGAVLKRVSTLGIPHNKTLTLTSQNQLQQIADYLKKNGIDDVTFRYRSWNTDELKGNKVNGISEFSGVSLKTLGESKDMRVYPAVLNLQLYSDAGFLDRMFNASSSITGLPFSWSGYSYSTLNETDETVYRLKIPKLQSNVEKVFRSFEKKNVKNLALGDIGNNLYCDFGGDGYRRGTVRAVMENLVKKAAQQTDSLMLDSPNSYSAVYADVIYNAPVANSNQDILDRSVPFYTMTLSGIAECVAPSFNNNNIGDDIMLYSVAGGASICYTWIYNDASKLIGTELSGLSKVNFDATKAMATEKYKLLSELYAKIDNSRIYSHEYLNDALSVTQYENGVKVYVNFGDTEQYTENGTAVAENTFTVEEAER